MGGEQVGHHGVVLMVIGGILVAGGHAVAADDGAIHGLGGVDDGGQAALGIHAVDIGVVEQALALEHVDIGHAGQIGILLNALLDAQGLELRHLVGGHAAANLTDIGGGAETRDAHGVLVLVLVVLVALGGLGNHHEVVQLGERGVVRAGAGHVDDALLEAHNLAGGDHGHAAQNMGLAAAHSLHLVDDAGEHAAGALNLHAGLDDILHRGDPDALAGLGDVKAEVLNPGLYVVVLIHKGLDSIRVNVQGTVFYLAFL